MFPLLFPTYIVHHNSDNTQLHSTAQVQPSNQGTVPLVRDCPELIYTGDGLLWWIGKRLPFSRESEDIHLGLQSRENPTFFRILTAVILRGNLHFAPH